MNSLPGKISICGRRQVDFFADAEVTHILAINDPEAKKVVPEWFKGVYHRMLFHDFEKLDNTVTSTSILPTINHVREILIFGARCFANTEGTNVHLLVHCHAGAHRSSAAAFAILTQHYGAGHATDALKYVMDVRPEAYPNKLMVKYADELLGLQGEMLSALQPLREQLGRVVAMPFPKRNRKPSDPGV